MPLRLFERREIWWPTRRGWIGLLALCLGVPLGWGLWGESLLAVTKVLPAQVLVVEGWIGLDAMPAAIHEFERGGYQLLVTAGGPTRDGWNPRDWNYAETAAREIIRNGLPKERTLAAPAGDTDSQRTYHSALAVRRALEQRGPLPEAINVLTRGSHARRSRLVYARVMGATTRVGVIAWKAERLGSKPWWRSSEQAKDFLAETVGYPFERLLGSGRWLRSGTTQ